MNESETSLSQLQSIAGLPRDLAVIKMENESIMSLAVAHRRDHAAIREELIEQLTAYPSFARVAVYTKPVGTVQVVDCTCGSRYEESGRSIGPCPRCGKVSPKGRPTQKKKFARGLSIRAAEAIAEVYGWNRVRVDVTEIDDHAVRIEATFVDLCKGRTYSDAGILSKTYRTRSGEVARIPDDRFYNLVVKAEASRRVREVILRCVPPGLRAELLEIAEGRMRQSLATENVDKIVSAFAEFRLTREDLERVVGRTVGAGWTEDDRFELLSLFNALKTNETTREEILEDLETPQPLGLKKGQRLSRLDEALQHTTTEAPAEGSISEQPSHPEPNPEPRAPQPAAEAPPEPPLADVTAQAPAPKRQRRPRSTSPERTAANDSLFSEDSAAEVPPCPDWAQVMLTSCSTHDEVERVRSSHAVQCANPTEWVGFMAACDARKLELI